jgi:hypothetical protein
MTRVVVSQSMYFPWVGMLEQMRLADVFVHYDDVQYVRGFCNRVQVKTERGVDWLSVPLRQLHRGQRIDEVLVDDREPWRARHREILRLAYRKAPYCGEMLDLVDTVFAQPVQTIAELSRASMLALRDYFGLADGHRYADSAALDIPGRSSRRLHDIVLGFGGTSYITGHGARNYLDHTLFEQAGITVEYMDYRKVAYPQLHGAFTPFVTALDLVANCGRAGTAMIVSTTTPWREFVAQTA